MNKYTDQNKQLCIERKCPHCGLLKTFPKRSKYCSRSCGAKARLADGNNTVQNSNTSEETREDEFMDDQWTIRMTSTRVKNYDQLVLACNVDLDIWEPERFKVKSYEVTYVPRATRTDGDDKWVRPSTKAVTVPMFAITASFIKKGTKLIKLGDRVEFIKQLHTTLQDDQFTFKSIPLSKITPVEKNHHEIAVVCSSDLHLTETVRPEDANGVNFYNSMVAANRLWAHVQRAKSILARHMAIYTIDKIWSPLLGDMINGTIHQEYVTTNDLSDLAATLLCSRLMYMFYQELKTLGIPIEISAVHGNHPRLTPNVPTKRQAHTNYDWVIYEMLSDKLQHDPQVSIEITTAQIGMKKLFNWNYLFEHGISVSHSKIEDFEDRLRALFDDPTYREATGYSGASFDQVVIGNLHKGQYLERTVVNSSYIGQNELGQSWRLKPIKAQQLMWGVSKSHVRTWQYNVDLTDIKHERIDNPFSEYTDWFLKKHGK